MTSYRGVVAVLAALAAMIAVTAGANLCPDFNQDFMCAVRINAAPVGFLQYAYASEVGGYEGYCTEVADNVFVDMTADVDTVYLDIIIAEYCDDTPIGAVSQYANDDSSIARDEDVVLILKALSSTPGHIQASLDHATGLYRGPEIVTEFGSGANALDTCVKFALGLWIKGAEDCGTPECYNFYVFADKASCLAGGTQVVSGTIAATAPATSTSSSFQLGVHCLPLGHADVPPAELVCQGTVAGGSGTATSEWTSTFTDGSSTALSDGVDVKVDAGVGELYMQIGFEAATVLAGNSATFDGSYWPISASFMPSLVLETTSAGASTLTLLDPSGSEVATATLTGDDLNCNQLDDGYYYKYAHLTPGAEASVFADDVCSDLIEYLETPGDAATVTETHTRTVACTDQYEMPYIQCYRGYTENPGPGFDVIFNEKNIFIPGCATIYSETGSNPATRSVLVPDPDAGISFWNVEMYDDYLGTGVCGSGDSTQDMAAYDVVQVDDDTTHYNLGYAFSFEVADYNTDSVYEYYLNVNHAIGDTGIPTSWSVNWLHTTPQCLHLVDDLWVNFAAADAGITGSAPDNAIYVYADNSCSELIVDELFVFFPTSPTTDTRTISISFVCEDKDLNEDVVEVEVDDGPNNDSGGSSCNDSGDDECNASGTAIDDGGSGCDGGVDTDCVPRTQLTYRQAGTSTNERFSTVDGALCFPVFTHSSGTGVYYLYFEDETNTFFTDNGCEIPAALPASPNSDDGVYYDWVYSIEMTAVAPPPSVPGPPSMSLDLDFALVTTGGPDTVDRSLTMGPNEYCVNVPDSDIWLTTTTDVIMIFHGEVSCFNDYGGSINYQFFEDGTVRTGTFQIDIDVFDPNSYSSANVAGDPHFFVRHPSSEAEGKDIVSVYDWKEVGHYHFLAFADHAVSLVVNEFAGCDGRMEGEYIASIAINTGGDTGAFGANSYHATCDAGITFANGTTAADNMLRVGTPCVTFLIVLDNGYLNIHEVVMSCKATGGVHALLEDHASANQAGWWEVKNGTFKLVADQAPKVVARRSPTRVIDLDL